MGRMIAFLESRYLEVGMFYGSFKRQSLLSEIEFQMVKNDGTKKNLSRPEQKLKLFYRSPFHERNLNIISTLKMSYLFTIG